MTNFPNYNVREDVIMNYHNMDALDYLRQLPDRSMDLIILDPPYYKVTKNRWDHQWKTKDEYNEWCSEWIRECSRVSKYSGNVWLFGYIKNIPHSFCELTNNNFNFRQQIIVQKSMRSIAGRTKMSQKLYPTITESIFHFHYEARPKIGELLETQRQLNGYTAKQINAYLGLSTNGGGAYSGMVNKNPEKMVYPKREYWDKLSNIFELPPYDDMVYMFNIQKGLRDVWSDIDFYDEERIHPTQKPIKLINRIIETCTVEGMNVLDPFSGSGATAVACDQLKRNFYGAEIDWNYFNLSSDRLRNTNNILSMLDSI